MTDHLDTLRRAFVLREGHSDNPAKGACIMDAVNWLVHGKHGDAPSCVSPALRGYCITGNDRMPHETRQRLLAYAHRLAGSKSPEHEAARLRVLVLGAVRVFTPRALDAAGLPDDAARLRALPDDVTFAMAARAAKAAWAAAAWDDYFTVLDAALNAGPQGEPWSADFVAAGIQSFERARVPA